jgi:hypothetical protein
MDLGRTSPGPHAAPADGPAAGHRGDAPACHGPAERSCGAARWVMTPHGAWWWGPGAGAHGPPASPVRPVSAAATLLPPEGGAPAAGKTQAFAVALSTPAWPFGGHRLE